MVNVLGAASRWIAHYPWVLMVVAAAYGAGLLSMLDFGYSLPEAAASLIGALIGAVAGVGGALSVVVAADYLQGRNIATYVLFSYQPVADLIGYLHGYMDASDESEGKAGWSPDTWKAVLESARSAVAAIDAAQVRIRRVEPNVHRMKAEAIHISNLLEEDAGKVKNALNGLIGHYDKAMMFYGGTLDAVVRNDLAVTTMSFLEKATALGGTYGNRSTSGLEEVGNRLFGHG